MPNKKQFWNERQEEFKRSLAEFEHCLETPFIPGELMGWLRNTRRAFEKLKPQFQFRIQHIHIEEFSEMTREDPGLFGRVEELKEEDENLTRLLEKLEGDFDRICTEAESGATETALKDVLNPLVTAGLEFVMRLRKQKVTVETWLTEAFTRDRGTVD